MLSMQRHINLLWQIIRNISRKMVMNFVGRELMLGPRSISEELELPLLIVGEVTSLHSN